MRKLFRPNINIDYSDFALRAEELASEIISIVAHYRNYFFKRGKYTTFYFLYSFRHCLEIIKDFPEYKHDYYQKYVVSKEHEDKIKVINKVWKVLEKVFPYIPNAYFNETSDLDELVYTKYILENKPASDLAYILTNDQIIFQCADKSTRIITPKGSNSKVLTEATIMSELTERDTDKISSKMIPLVLSMAGYKKYNIPKIQGIAVKKAVDILEALVSSGKIEDKYSVEFPIKFSELSSKNKNEKILLDNSELISKNYAIISAEKYLNSHKLLLSNRFVSVPRESCKAVLLEMDSRLFVNYPINLEMLTKGEKV